MFSIVIPNYNGEEMLKKSIPSLKKAIDHFSRSNPGEKGKLEVIVVDNASRDGSISFLEKEELPRFRLIKNDTNLGFARPVNQGIVAAGNDNVVVLNNDLRLGKNWFSLLGEEVKRARGKKIGVFFGKVLTWDGEKIESTGLEYFIKGKAKNRGNGEPAKTKKYQRKEFIFGASASAVIYRKEAVLEAGLFDEDFFAYEEDVDLALRLYRLGWKTVYFPGAVSYHEGGATSKKMSNLRQINDAKNWWFIIIKNYPFSLLVKQFPAILTERLRNASGLVKATPAKGLFSAFVKAYLPVVLKLPAMVKKRNPLPKDMFYLFSRR